MAISCSGVIVANLDFERELAQQAAAFREQQHALPQLPQRVLRAASAMGTLLRVFARPGDSLWTPCPVQPDRVTDVLGLPRPTLVSGPSPVKPRQGQPFTDVLAWGETRATSAWREAGPSTTSDANTEWVGRLWSLPRPRPAIAAQANNRVTQLELTRSLGLALPGACCIASLQALERHLRHGGAAASRGRWIAKAPFSAAGRDRMVAGPHALEDVAQRRRVAHMLARFGQLLFEPWMDRVDDFGCCVLVDAQHIELLGIHRQQVHAAGGFAAATVCPEAALGLPDGQMALLTQTALRVAKQLQSRGYRGPLGIDAWRFHNAQGHLALHPLGEINARMTFGLVAQALARHCRRRYAASTSYTLRLGTRVPVTADSIELLQAPAGSADPTTATLEAHPWRATGDQPLAMSALLVKE